MYRSRYSSLVDGIQLLRLGRRLSELGREHVREPGDIELTSAEQEVMAAVITLSDAGIGDIVRETGFSQSHVSALVAAMRERGLLTTGADPADRRRTRVHAAEHVVRGMNRRGARAVDATLTATLGDPARASRAAALLDELAPLLLSQPDD